MIRLNVTLSVPPAASGSVIGRIRKRFMYEAGGIILDAIRSLLGTNTLYTLSRDYAARKQRSGKLRRIAGKSADQPLILTATMFDNLTVIPDGDGFIVMVQDGQAVSDKGFDYAEHWEEITDYLGKGLDLVENKLDELMADIIVDEMLL